MGLKPSHYDEIFEDVPTSLIWLQRREIIKYCDRKMIHTLIKASVEDGNHYNNF
jgi:hypothetical protein